MRQPLALGVFRSDYMVDEGGDAVAPGAPPRLRQIELNTISSAFAGLSPRVTALHAFLAQRYPRRVAAVVDALGGGAAAAEYVPELPSNDATSAVAAALAAAVEAYAARPPAASRDTRAANGSDAVVAFIVQPRERNVMDQRLLEYALWEGHGVRAVRVTLAELRVCAELRPSDGALMLRAPGGGGADEVAVVYYRCGYTPDDYPTEAGESCCSGGARGYVCEWE